MATKKKKKPRPSYRALLAVLVAVVLAACSSAPPVGRMTTEEERAEAFETLGLIQNAATAALMAEKIKPEDLNLVLQQLGQIEQDIRRSETEPVTWSSIANRITMLAVAWAVREG